MNSNLDKLAQNLSDIDFKYLVDVLILKKFSEEKLPSRKRFYRYLKNGRIRDDDNKLDGHISHEEYLTFEKSWDLFGMKNMGDWLSRLLIEKKNVFLLGDVFEKFIEMCLKFHGLDPCHYFSSLGLSWDAMLKMTDLKLEKTVDIDMYLFIEKGKEELFLILLKDMLKQRTNIWKIITLKSHQNL